MGRGLIVVIGAALLAVVAWFAFGARGGGTPETPAVVTMPESAAEASPRAAVAGARADAPPAPQQLERTSATPERDLRARIVGRCVDDDGAPLVGVRVALDGEADDVLRATRHRLARGEVAWTDPPDVTTDGDGRFEHRFAPPPPFSFTCRLIADGRVSRFGRWGEIAPGAVLDMGDVVLERGVEVSGRVVDEGGAGIAGYPVVMLPIDPPRVGPEVGLFIEAGGRLQERTDAAGSFRSTRVMRAGSYRLQDATRSIVAPQTPIEIAPPRAELRIVVRPSDDDARPTITGRVVDDAGTPLDEVAVWVDGQRFAGTRTTADGAFALQPPRAMPATPVRLVAEVAGHAAWRADEPIAWGTDDLRIVLPAGPPLSIFVRRALDGTPVDEFGVVLAPIRNDGTWSARDCEVLHLGRHERGQLTIPHAATGRFVLRVVPMTDSGLAVSLDREVEVVLDVPQRIDVALTGFATRGVDVVDAGGRPIAGATVELLWSRAEDRVTVESSIEELAAPWYDGEHDACVRVDTATTDAGGHAEVRGPRDRRYGVRVQRESSVPQVAWPVALGDAGAVRVVLSSGGRLRGQVGPPDVFAQLLADAGMADSEAPTSARAPSLYLRRERDGVEETFPNGVAGVDRFLIERDGRFAIDGIPAGAWDVVILWAAVEPGGGSASWLDRVVARGVEVTDDVARDVALDLEALRAYPVVVRVTVDDAPLRGRLVLWSVPSAAGERSQQRRVACDGADEVVVDLAPGPWGVLAVTTVGGVTIHATGPRFVVQRGAPPAPVRFDARTGSRRLVVETPDGGPARVRLEPVVDFGLPSDAPVATDAEGRVTLFGQAGSQRYRVRRRPLVADADFTVWRRENTDNAWIDRAYVELGPIDLLAGDPGEELHVRLPAEWAELPR